MENTRQIFCAKDQKVTTYKLSVEPNNGEILAECTEPGCDRFLKFPATLVDQPAEFTALLADHQASAEGQVSLEKVEALLPQLSDGAQPAEQAAPAEQAPAETLPEAPSADAPQS